LAQKDNPPPDYDTLLRLYGESMLRVEQLEAQVASPGESSPQGDDAQALAISKLTERVEALQGQIAQSSESSDAAMDAQPADHLTDEVAQMRLQITSLANQLDGARREIQDYRTRRRRRSRRPERLPWWRSLARRFGISRPQGP
jgi:chromosome segregation ATPase